MSNVLGTLIATQEIVIPEFLIGHIKLGTYWGLNCIFQCSTKKGDLLTKKTTEARIQSFPVRELVQCGGPFQLTEERYKK